MGIRQNEIEVGMMRKSEHEFAWVMHITPPFTAKDVQYIMDNMRSAELTKLAQGLHNEGLNRPFRNRDVAAVLVRFGLAYRE